MITFFILQEHVECKTEGIYKPHQIRDYEHLAEGDHVINCCMDHCVMKTVPVLNQGKRHKVEHCVRCHRGTKLRLIANDLRH